MIRSSKRILNLSWRSDSELPYKFYLVALTPPGLPDPSLAIAASRAGGLGILDLEYTKDLNVAMGALEKIAAQTDYAFGIKLNGKDDASIADITPALPENIWVVILTSWQDTNFGKYIEKFHSENRQVILEITSLEQALLVQSLGLDGFLAKGNEAAGAVGEKTAFILLQQIASQVELPVWVQGGVGLHTIAACYAGGAAGVVLDSQLVLTREAPFSDAVKKQIRRMDGSETLCVGSNIGAPYRIYALPGHPIIKTLLDLEMSLEKVADNSNPQSALSLWNESIRNAVGWGEDGTSLWPLGQDIAFASVLAERFGTVGAIFQAFRLSLKKHIHTAKSCVPLGINSPLARSHGTPYPIVQGPMARVSDTAKFAARVAEEGALPFIALSTLKENEIKGILKDVHGLLQGRPWGVGLLGFNEEELLRSQIQAIEPFSPPFAILAGGRTKQASALESKGITTYVHVPSVGILEMFIDSGARHFIFEGNECGGHIGPRPGFVLWEGAIQKLQEALKSGCRPEDFHLLFAGGIHDALSASMVAAMVAPLAERGVRVGVLLGTAYLFTEEVIETGGIVEDFQKKALLCSQTKLLEISPGHALRCIDTPFVTLFKEMKRKLQAEKRSSEEVRANLEESILGRSRIASKGIVRNPSCGADRDAPYLISVSKENQHADGLYMVGQLAALRNKTSTLKELHEDVSVRSSNMLASLHTPDEDEHSRKPGDVAIIGMACVFPKAGDLRTYWENILNSVNAITEVPSNRWDWRLYFDEDKRARDKIYSRWGGFLDDISFDPVKYGIPPNSLHSIEPLHLMTLEVVRTALKDAGYEEREFPRERTSVIIGTGAGIGDLGQRYILRATLPTLFEIHSDEVMKRLHEWTEDSFPGILMNVLAGRVANRFNLGGVNYTIDAACASSLAALYDAARELETGSSDMVIVGGVDAGQSPFTYTCFSKTSALSPNGKCRVFDEKADGTVISEGLAVLVMKRLSDAERDGDRIYAVLKAVAGSSDGRGMGLTAPRTEGQMVALKRAYAKAGFTPDTVELFEAHGTGTVVGDQVEAESVMQLLKENHTAKQSCAIGSVKSMIGHTKGAAGMAGVIKTALSLYHKVLPPTMGVDKPNPKIDFLDGPLYINTEVCPWVGNERGPRRAGVNAFGFGGTNFHAVLEQYSGEIPEDKTPAVMDRWPIELLLWSGGSRNEIVSAIENLRQSLEAGAQPRLGDIAYTLHKALKECGNDQDGSPLKLAIVASSLEDLKDKLVLAHQAIREQQFGGISDPRGIYFTGEQSINQGKVAFLFPGQGSQYPDMLRELAMLFPEVLACFERANAVLREKFPEGLSSYIFPPPHFTPDQEREQRQKLSQTNIAQPALGAACYGMFKLLQKMGMNPDMTAGHSYGEYVALAAAGVFDEDTLYTVSEARGRLIIEAANGNDLGTMVAVKANASELKDIIKGIDGVVIANINSPNQTIISGEKGAIEKAVELFKSRDIHVQPMAVAAAFHSPVVAPAKRLFSDLLKAVQFATPQVEVFSNTFAAPYERSREEIESCLAEHMVRPVEFVREIEAMYERGARIFVEVGPGSVLTNLTKQILEGRHFLAVATNSQGQPALSHLLKAIGQLAVNHVPISLEPLFHGRALKSLDFNNFTGEEKEMYSPTTWLVNGTGIVRPGKVWRERTNKMTLDGYKLRDRRSVQEKEHEQEKDGSIKPSLIPMNHRLTKENPSPLAGEGGFSEQTDTVMFQFQQLMSQFLEMQKGIMMAYLQGTSQSAPVSSVIPHTTPQELKQKPAISTPDEHHQGVVRDPLQKDKEPLPPLNKGGMGGGTKRWTTSTAHISSDQVRFDEEYIKKSLLKVTSERTGYPEEMLQLDADIEADLGIDSIKRVEIMGAFAKCFPEAERQKIQSVMDELSRLKTLNAVVKRAAEVLLATVQRHENIPDLQADKAVASVRSEQTMISREKIVGDLLKVTSERTGYPEEMLQLDADIEADLGIDSIKRVEIMGAFVKCFPEAERQKIQVAIDELSRLKTLSSVIEKTAGILLAGSKGIETGSDGRVPRFLLEPVITPAPEEELQIRERGVFIVTDDNCGISETLAQSLKERGGQVVILRMHPSSVKMDGNIYGLNLTDPASVEALIKEIRLKHGPIIGLIHLLPLGHSLPSSQMDLQTWRESLKTEVKSLFYLAKILGTEIQEAGRKGGGWLVAVTTLNGSSNGNCFVGQAGIAGLLKTVAQEWTEVKCRVIHMDVTLPPLTLSGQLINEMAAGDKIVEVEYKGLDRIEYKAKPAPLLNNGNIEKIHIDSNWVIMVTGGAAGITAEIACELADKYRPTLLLVGRSSFPEDESPETALLTSPKDIKEALIKQLRTHGDNPTPAIVEAAYARLIKNREIRRNIERMRSAGSKVHYYSADVRDEHQFGNIIDELYTLFGHIDGVIHGAGIIEDKLLEDKSPDSFDRVFDTKVDSAFILTHKIRADYLKFIAFFTSVAGCFGNRGQVDYASANEVVNKLALSLDKEWKGRVVAVNWGPWRKAGMVTPGVERQFKERGIHLIPLDAGCRIFEEEIRFGSKGEVEVVIGDGPWMT